MSADLNGITDRLEDLDDLGREDLSTLRDDINAAYEEADSNDDLDTMETLVEALEQVQSHIDAQAEDTDEDSTDDTEDESSDDSDEAESKDESDEDESDETDEAEDTSEAPDGAAADETAEVEAEADTDTTAEEKLPMAASAEIQPKGTGAEVTETVPVTVTAGADIPGMTAGSEYHNVNDVSQAFVQRLNTIKRARGGDGAQYPVATITASIPEERMLAPGDIEGNAAKIAAVTDEQAIVASGGFCAPLPVKYDIFGLGSTDRPIKSALPTFGATRGGIRYVQPPTLGDYEDAIALWTAENDANPSNPATKPCLKVECANPLDAEVDAVTLCLTFGNLMSRAYPELVARHNQLALVQHARFAELNLLSQISAASLKTTSDFKLGVARDFLLAVGKAAAAYRNRHRVGRTTPLRVVAPEWVLDAMREDIAQGLPGDKLAEADSIISGYLAARNVNVTWHMDDTFAAQTAGALVDFPATIKWYIFAEGTFLLLDGGTLDLGVVRDSELVGTNDYKTFVENFEAVAKVGVESVEVTTTTHVDGAVVGAIAPTEVTP